MTEQALKALKESIEHWEKLAAGVPGQKIGASACALCSQFNPRFMDWDKRCFGCPVSDRTGINFCRGTPWQDIEKAIEPLLNEEVEQWTLTDKAKALAAKELAFLKSLLP